MAHLISANQSTGFALLSTTQMTRFSSVSSLRNPRSFVAQLSGPDPCYAPMSSSNSSDRVTLSDRAQSLSDSVASGFNAVGDFVENSIDSAAEANTAVYGKGVRQYARFSRLPLDAAAGIANFLGADSTSKKLSDRADRQENTTVRIGDSIVGAQEGFYKGVGDGLSSVVRDVGTAVSRPVETVQGLNRLANAVTPGSVPIRALMSGRSPAEVLAEDRKVVGGVFTAIGNEYVKSYEDHGVMGALGRGSLDVVGSLATGGSTTVGRTTLKAAARAGDVWDAASNVAAAGQAGTVAYEQQ